MTDTDIAYAVQELRLVDTHEHLVPESMWLERSCDVLLGIFSQYYSRWDLAVAGATSQAIERLHDPSSDDVAARFEGIRRAWEAIQHTGYGEVVRLVAREIYGIEELTAPALEQAQSRVDNTAHEPGEMHQLLADRARIDHVQIHHLEDQWKRRAAFPDGNLYLHDISWWDFCRGQIPLESILEASKIDVTNLTQLNDAMAAIFARFGPSSVAVKSAHAYNRTLLWEERSDEDASRALASVLAGGEVDDASRVVLGDWCWARGVELAIEHNLPFKLHTGYLDGTGYMMVDGIRPGKLCALLSRYPEARFVLMHAGYPYGGELVAIAKHYPNVFVDLCWAWSIDPYSSSDFLRRFLHAVPANKLFAFGGDTCWPTSVVAYAAQARGWLIRTLEAEVATSDMTEHQAIGVARRIMRDNQYACFDIERARSFESATAA